MIVSQYNSRSTYYNYLKDVPNTILSFQTVLSEICTRHIHYVLKMFSIRTRYDMMIDIMQMYNGCTFQWNIKFNWNLRSEREYDAKDLQIRKINNILSMIERCNVHDINSTIATSTDNISHMFGIRTTCDIIDSEYILFRNVQ